MKIILGSRSQSKTLPEMFIQEYTIGQCFVGRFYCTGTIADDNMPTDEDLISYIEHTVEEICDGVENMPRLEDLKELRILIDSALIATQTTNFLYEDKVGAEYADYSLLLIDLNVEAQKYEGISHYFDVSDSLIDTSLPIDLNIFILDCINWKGNEEIVLP